MKPRTRNRCSAAARENGVELVVRQLNLFWLLLSSHLEIGLRDNTEPKNEEEVDRGAKL